MEKPKGIKQYEGLVGEVFSKNQVLRNRRNDVCVVEDLESLKRMPVGEVFYGGVANGNNIPRAIALNRADPCSDKYFFPLVVVSCEYFDEVDRSTIIRRNIVSSSLSDESDLLQVQTSLGEGYQAIAKQRGLEKEGMSAEELSELKRWLKSTIAIRGIFGSRELWDIERKFFQEGKVLGRGLARACL